MSASTASTTGRIAIALAIVVIMGLIFITFFDALIERDNHFGAFKDICVAVGGIFSGWLAWKLYPTYRRYAPRESSFALGFGITGGFLVLISSALVIFNTPGWFLAGLITTFGYGMIGLWLLGLNNSALHWLAFPRGLAQFGMITGWIMIIGILAVPGILARTDTRQTADWFVWIAFCAGGLSWNILYTTWCIGLGRLLLTNQ